MSDETLSAGLANSLVSLATGPAIVGGVNFFAEERLLSANGREVRLEPKTAELLTFLVDQMDNPVTREALLDEVWGQDGSDEALTQAISRLRRALKDLGGQPSAIETVPRVGYRLVETEHPNPAVFSMQPSEAATPEVAAESGGHTGWRATHAIAFGAGVLTGVTVIMLIIFIWFTPATENVEIRIGPDGQIMTDEP